VGHDYELSLWNASQVSSVEGAELTRGDELSWLHFAMPANPGRSTSSTEITIHFAAEQQRKESRKR